MRTAAFYPKLAVEVEGTIPSTKLLTATLDRARAMDLL